MSEFNVSEELKKLPHEPGVYIMRDADDTIMYVGKAKDLHQRVRSYFRKIVGRGPYIDKMVSLIDRFEYIVTDSEMEALVLENNLIKENSPKYNTMLKDDKTYPYIKITLGEEYPRVVISRRMTKDKSKYFGPYQGPASVKDVIDLVNKLFKLRTCRKQLPQDIGTGRACLNYHMGQCMSPCEGRITHEEYDIRVRNAIDFLNGDYKDAMKNLEKRMLEHSEKMEFEEAAKIRDLFAAVKRISDRQKLSTYDEEEQDIVAVACDDSDAVIQVFFVRGGKMVGRDHYHMTNVSGIASSEILLDFVKQFYGGTPFIPSKIILSEEVEEVQLLEEWLTAKRGAKTKIVIPKIGQKEKLVELASKNALLLLTQDKDELKRREAKTIAAVHDLEQLLDIPNLNRLEAFDISNISGFLNVGSMVVFERGVAKKNDYRKFRMKTVEGPNDYACMKEVLTRRFVHGMEEKSELKEKDIDESFGSFSRFPDLIMMDGGRGQVNIALEVLDELGLQIPVCGMVKDNHHNTRGLYFNNVEIPIDTHSEGFKLITRIQDEAHRFAIEFHRSLRSKSQTHSVLDDIPGVGEARRRAIMRAFRSIDEVRKASVEELSSINEIPINVAEAIYAYFNGSDSGSMT